MAEEKYGTRAPHRLLLDDCKTLSVSGVSDVDSFDENTVVVYTDHGELTVKGEALHVQRLNVETGELQMEGQIRSASYAEASSPSGGFFRRLFK